LNPKCSHGRAYEFYTESIQYPSGFATEPRTRPQCYMGLYSSCYGTFELKTDSKSPYSQYCDCKYLSGGCSISIAPPSGTACKCSYDFLFTCGGKVVGCSDPNSDYCAYPDISKRSCNLGGGDCGGYSCDCGYKWGGCKISKAAPSGNACKCNYKGAWTCGGEVVYCSDRYSPFCTSPDLSKKSCDFGKGDCGGY
jgi:hypothetical protein